MGIGNWKSDFGSWKSPLVSLAVGALLLIPLSCSDQGQTGVDGKPMRIMYTSAGGRINTLDPVMAADLVSQYMVASFYDTLLQYDYTARPYKLIPSMLATMPDISPDMKRYEFTLRRDLYFQDDPCFQGLPKSARRITSEDVVFSLLRIADERLHSPGFWLLRKKIKGIDRFRELTSYTKAGNLSIYDDGCPGFEIIDEQHFVIQLNKPDPRLLYSLAMPYTGIVPRKAVEFYEERFAEHPVGSGPFRLVKWRRGYQIVLERNSDYRKEFFKEAENPNDRERPLPLVDKIVCYLVRQPLSCWLMFLQGELDMNALNKENFEIVVSDSLKLVPALKKRGIKMYQIPGFQINYIGFSFADPLLATNLELRKAISLAYNTELRLKHFNYRVIPAQGPIPPGVPGFDPKLRNPYAQHDLEKAKEHLAKAGYPGGKDPKTGEPLVLTFDQSGTTPQHRQLAELMVDDMKKIGITVKPVLNNKARFFQKLRKGQLQMFRLSWIGDYPDAENFLQLFYGPNAGSCNRVFYRDPEFDKMFEEIITMPDTPERTEKYKKMAAYIIKKCPWIFESYPIDYRLVHNWLENYIPHDFAFARWKYLSVDVGKRSKMRREFKPLSMRELREK